MKRRPWRSVLLSVLMSWSAAATCKPAETVSASYVVAIEYSGRHIAYLLGSSHASFRQSPVRIGQCAKEKLKSSHRVFLEADIAEVRTYVSSGIATHSMKSVLATMEDVARSNLRQTLMQQLNAGDALDDVDAATVINALENSVPGRLETLGPVDFGLDTEVYMASRFLDIPVDYLESPQEQVRFLIDTPPASYAAAIRYLSGVISQPAESKRYLDGALQLQLASARGDEAALLEWFRSSGLASYYQHTITARNPDLLRKIDRLIRDGKERPVFIALGAAHLPGQEGLVSGLRKLGWTVKRLCQ